MLTGGKVRWMGSECHAEGADLAQGAVQTSVPGGSELCPARADQLPCGTRTCCHQHFSDRRGRRVCDLQAASSWVLEPVVLRR